MSKKIDMIGKQYNNWIVIKQEDTIKVKLRYLAKCLLCKGEYNIIGESVRNGRSKQCKQCSIKLATPKKKDRVYKSKYTLEDRKIRYILKRYKSDCRHRKNKQDWNLKYIEFKELIQGNCFYCEEKPYTKINIYPPSSKVTEKLRQDGWITYNGIDRVDNKKGYNLENVVTCCKICNRMKSSLTKEEFLSHIKKIYNAGQTSDQLK